MKKTLAIILIAATGTWFAGCGESQTPDKKELSVNALADISNNPDYKKGLELIGKSDCLTCHKINERATGPAYSDVAAKYAPAADTTIQRLAGKIINGGTGVWGVVPMTPHPQIPLADAEQMVKYILLLKNS